MEFAFSANNGVVVLIPASQISAYNLTRLVGGNPYQVCQAFLFIGNEWLKKDDANFHPNETVIAARQVFHGSVEFIDELGKKWLITLNYDIPWDKYVPLSQVGFGKQGQQLDALYLLYRPTTEDFYRLFNPFL